MTLKTYRLGGGKHFEFTYETPEQRTNFLSSIFIPGTTDKIAAWNGHEFEAVKVRKQEYDSTVELNVWDTAVHAEYYMTLHYPIDPRIIETDVKGAIRAYANADNTGWLFAHTDAGTHHDYELNLMAALDGVMQPLFRQAQVDLHKPGNSEPTVARLKKLYDLLSQFYGQCIIEARKRARAVWLGYREQYPHPANGYLDEDITQAINTIEASWKPDRQKDLDALGGSLRYLRTSLTMPAVETRWDKIARLNAEAKAKAEAEASNSTEQPAGNGD